MFKLRCVAAILLAALMASHAAAAVTKAEAEKRCHIGEDKPTGPQGERPNGLSESSGGLTPYSVPGATYVSRYEADCLAVAYEFNARFVTPLGDKELIPFTMRVPGGGNGPSASEDPRIAARLEEITGGNKDYPLIAYCHNERCFLSYNLALRAAKLGYRNLYWLRDGIESHSTMLIDGEYRDANREEHENKFLSEIWFCRSFYRLVFPEQGKPLVDAIDKLFNYAPGKRADLDETRAAAEKEVTEGIAEARKRDGEGTTAGKAPYWERYYKNELDSVCTGIMRGAGFFG